MGPMAMAMPTLQSCAAFALGSSARIAIEGLGAGWRGSGRSIRRAPLGLSVRNSLEFCGKEDLENVCEGVFDLGASDTQGSPGLTAVDLGRSTCRRRDCLLAMAMSGVLVSQERAHAEEIEAEDAPNLELYVDEKEGFKLLRPALWNKVEKAGATVLFEDPVKRGNTIGVVVNPVRIASLKDFGTPDVVADRLIAAERKKPSTNDAQLVRVLERQAQGDIPLYVLEYTLDSTRGQKRVLSAVTVASKKLYILNITYVDSPASPAPAASAEAFEQVLNSFDLVA